MYNFDETVDHFIDSYDANKLTLDYLKKCRLSLAKVSIINIFLNLTNVDLIQEAQTNLKKYIKEVKEDRYYLKLISKIIKKLYINGVDEFEYDLVALLKCIELKDINLAQTEGYYIEKIKSNIDGYLYIAPQVDDKIDEYNGKITELVKRLHQNALDYKE